MQPETFGEIINSIDGKIFKGGMILRTLLTTLIQIIYKTVINFQIIIKSIEDLDDNL